MATNQSPVGVDHLTVVPANFDPDTDDETACERPGSEQ